MALKTAKVSRAAAMPVRDWHAAVSAKVDKAVAEALAPADAKKKKRKRAPVPASGLSPKQAFVMQLLAKQATGISPLVTMPKAPEVEQPVPLTPSQRVAKAKRVAPSAIPAAGVSTETKSRPGATSTFATKVAAMSPLLLSEMTPTQQNDWMKQLASSKSLLPYGSRMPAAGLGSGGPGSLGSLANFGLPERPAAGDFTAGPNRQRFESLRLLPEAGAVADVPLSKGLAGRLAHGAAQRGALAEGASAGAVPGTAGLGPGRSSAQLYAQGQQEAAARFAAFKASHPEWANPAGRNPTPPGGTTAGNPAYAQAHARRRARLEGRRQATINAHQTRRQNAVNGPFAPQRAPLPPTPTPRPAVAPPPPQIASGAATPPGTTKWNPGAGGAPSTGAFMAPTGQLPSEKVGSLQQFAMKLAEDLPPIPGGTPTPAAATSPFDTSAADAIPRQPLPFDLPPTRQLPQPAASPPAGLGAQPPASVTTGPPPTRPGPFAAIGNAAGQAAKSLGSAVRGVGATVQRTAGNAIQAGQDAYTAAQSGFAPAWLKLKGGDIAGAWSALPEKWQNILTGVGGGAGMLLLVLLLSKLFGKQASYSDEQVDEALDVMGRLSDKQRLTLYKSAMEQTAFTALRMSRPQSRTMKMRPGTQVTSHKFQPGHQFQGIKQADLLPGGKADDVADSQFPADAVAKGQAVEKEHTGSPGVAKEVAKDHLTESPRYYDSLEEMEEELTSRSKKAEAFAIQMAD